MGKEEGVEWKRKEGKEEGEEEGVEREGMNDEEYLMSEERGEGGGGGERESKVTDRGRGEQKKE